MKINRQLVFNLSLAFIFFFLIHFLMSAKIISQYYQLNIYLLFINIIMATSLNLVNGFLGQLHLGYAGFMAIGAYTSAAMTTNMDLPFLPSILVGSIAAFVVGVLVGYPILRLGGDYLAIATLGFGEIVRIMIVNTEYVGGARGLSGIPRYTNWPILFLITVAIILLIRNYINSSHGRAVLSIREDEIAAETMGINLTKYKVMTFAIAAFFAGTAGALYAHYFFIITPATFNFLKSVDYLVMAVLGGLGSITGSIFAATGLTIISALLQDFGAVRMIAYSVVLVAIMLFRPSGLMGTKEMKFSFLDKKGGNKE